MKVYKKLALLALLLLVLGLLRAQVDCTYYGLKDTLRKDMIANLYLINWGEEEAHHALDARVYAESGQLLYRYYVPHLINPEDDAHWSMAPERNPTDEEVLFYKNARIIQDELDLENYTGRLRWSLTLRDHHDTSLVVSSKELLLPVREGILRYDQIEGEQALNDAGYYDGLSVHLPQVAERFTLADLENINVRNISDHPIYDDLTITLWQDSFYAPLYEVTLKNFPVLPGEYNLSPEELASNVLVDRYEARDTLGDLYFQARFGYAGLESTNISFFKHGTRFPPLETHHNTALNLSLDFVMTPGDMEQPFSPDNWMITENQEGEILDLRQWKDAEAPSLPSANPFGGAFTNRAIGSILVYLVLRGDDLPREKTGGFLAMLANLDNAYYQTVQRGPFEITFPSLNHANQLPPLERKGGFNFAVRYNNLLYSFGMANTKPGGNPAALKVASTINSIEINGHQLQFDFGATSTSWPTNVSVVPGTKTTTLSTAEYQTRWQTFLHYTEENRGKSIYEIGQGQETEATIIAKLLSSPYPLELIEAVTFPSPQQQVLASTGRFEFRQHTEADIDAAWGAPTILPPSDPPPVKELLEAIEWTTTLGIDQEDNLTKWVFLNNRETTGSVAREVTVSGRHLMFADEFYDDLRLTGFTYSICRYPAAEVPRAFRPAMTVQFNRSEIEIKKVTLHEAGAYEIYRSPLTTGFHNEPGLPGMSILVATTDYLYQFTVIGANEDEVLSWLNTVSVEGKSLNITPQQKGYTVQLK